jgi:hypothetical protein
MQVHTSSETDGTPGLDAPGLDMVAVTPEMDVALMADMFTAWSTVHSGAATTEPPQLDVYDQKQYILKNMDSLSKDKKITFVKAIQVHAKTLPSQGSEGILVNLDIYADDVVGQLYQLVKFYIDGEHPSERYK